LAAEPIIDGSRCARPKAFGSYWVLDPTLIVVGSCWQQDQTQLGPAVGCKSWQEDPAQLGLSIGCKVGCSCGATPNKYGCGCAASPNIFRSGCRAAPKAYL